MLRKFHSILWILAMIASLGTFSSLALASQGPGGDDKGGGNSGHESKAKGFIAAVDVNANTITVSDKKKGLITIGVDSSTEIRKNGNKNATLADLMIGDRVDARYDGTTLIARRVRVKSAKVEGVLTAVDLQNNSITITPSGGAPVQLFVTADTKIERNEKHVTLADLQIGDQAEATFNGNTASKVETTGP
jgi:Domain of unknown function (DUF5666)